jgi:hypothetical protein
LRGEHTLFGWKRFHASARDNGCKSLAALVIIYGEMPAGEAASGIQWFNPAIVTCWVHFSAAPTGGHGNFADVKLTLDRSLKVSART